MDRSFGNEENDQFLREGYESIYNNNTINHPTQSNENSYADLLMNFDSNAEMNKSEAEMNSLEQFAEFLNCFICYKRVKDPVLCQACSKFSCEGCLKKWLAEEKNECPFCRAYLDTSQMVKCRFLNDFSKILDSLKLQRIKNYSIYEKNESIDKCSEHSLKMIYFCTDCSEVICSDCVMFSDKHKSHKIERLRSIFEKKIDAINKEMNELKNNINKHENYVTEIGQIAEQLKESKDKKNKDLVLLTRALNSKLESELAARLQKLSEEKRKVDEHLDYLENMYSDISHQLDNSTPAKTVTRSNNFLQQLLELNNKKLESSIPKNFVSDYENDVSLKYSTGVFFLKPYSQYKTTNEIVFSDPLVADGLTWRIKVYPNGTGIYKGLYLSLFVELVKGWENGGTYCYKVILIKPGKENENIEREYISEFENSICWGYNRFCKLDDIENQGFWDRENDQILLKYQVKPANHLQKIKDQENYIKSLEDKLHKEKVQVRKMKQIIKKDDVMGKNKLRKISEKKKKDSLEKKYSTNTDFQKLNLGNNKIMLGHSLMIDQKYNDDTNVWKNSHNNSLIEIDTEIIKSDLSDNEKEDHQSEHIVDERDETNEENNDVISQNLQNNNEEEEIDSDEGSIPANSD